MPTIEEILRAAKEAGASDVHLTVGIPPKMRVNGNLITMDYPKMLPADTLEVLVNIMTEVQRERFEERGEYDMSFSIPNCGRYRVNAYKQRGSVALAFRLVGTKVPSPEELGVPESVIDLYQRKRGLVLVTGPTGSGKSTTMACLIDGSTIPGKATSSLWRILWNISIAMIAVSSASARSVPTPKAI